MRIGIDASNLRRGGGRTHLVELLRHADGNLGPVDRVAVWGSAETLAALPDRPWLERCHQPMLDGSLVQRTAWLTTRLVMLAREVDLVFAPGGFSLGLVRPRVVMSRNLLPFEPGEREAYGTSPTRARLEILRRGQSRSFAEADGVIFLNQYALDTVRAAMPRPPRRIAVIPHGIAERFHGVPRPARALDQLTAAAPLRVLYVSTIAPYKHQLEVIAAMHALSARVPVELTLVGVADQSPYSHAVMRAAGDDGFAGPRVRYRGAISFDELHHAYNAAEVFVFASSCENMPNILLEAMSNGLPIACARRGPMPEMLGDAGVYFDPQAPAEIADALWALASDPERRMQVAALGAERARPFTWERCARDTFRFLAEVAEAA